MRKKKDILEEALNCPSLCQIEVQIDIRDLLKKIYREMSRVEIISDQK
jgi:hypothetical protein